MVQCPICSIYTTSISLFYIILSSKYVVVLCFGIYFCAFCTYASGCLLGNIRYCMFVLVPDFHFIFPTLGLGVELSSDCAIH